jgi:flavin-dependent dehydrogenase
LQTNQTSITKYQCAIIGGGLAGLALAIQQAKAGKKVILFEKESYPYHKVCGEYISMESWPFLNELGLDLKAMNLPVINKLNISSPSGNTIHHNLQLGGFGISRYTLDKLLADLAKSCGAIIMENTKVNTIQFANENFTIETEHGNYTADIACGSYGKRSNLDIKLQRNFLQQAKPANNYIGVKYHVKANLPKNVIELHNFEDGYCGISAVDDDRYCLCYLTTAANLRNNNNSIEQMEQNVLMKNPHLKRYLTDAKRLYTVPLTISQISFTKKTIVDNHILMIGDTAGLITPLCGNGMSMALHASKIANQLIVDFFDNKITRSELEKTYQKQWKKQFFTRLKIGRIFQQLFGKSFITNLFIASVKPFPFLINKLVRLTHGKRF